MNRAYEVLKDEDLRKKYDKYGEKGLDEQQGGRYESWNYYRYDFGRFTHRLYNSSTFKCPSTKLLSCEDQNVQIDSVCYRNL